MGPSLAPTDPIPDDPQYGNAVYSAVSLLSMALISILFGLRLKSFGLHSFKSIRAMTPMRFIVVSIYICGIALMFSLGMMLSGVGLSNLLMCRLGIYLCYIWYVCGNKVLMYLFLVERAHAVRAASHRRARDVFWWCGILLIFLGFGTITTMAFVFPAYIDSSPHGCMMGLPPWLLIPLLVFDFTINTLLTALFVYFLTKMLKFRGGFTERCAICRVMRKLFTPAAKFDEIQPVPIRPSPAVLQSANTGPFNVQLEVLIKKSLIGCLMALVPTMINLAVLLHYNGFEEGWACFSGCSLDVTWSVVVVHWLTTAETPVIIAESSHTGRSCSSRRELLGK